MANEIRVTAALEIANGTFSLPRIGAAQLTFDQAGAGGGVPGQVTATTAGVDVDLSALGTEGWLWMKNLDDENFVEWGAYDGAAFHPIGRMEPGEPAVFRLSPGKTLHLKADTASCLVQVLANED